MAEMSFSCATCAEVFRDRSALKDHVKRVHQEVVKATFKDGTAINIKRDNEGMFKCKCGRRLVLPSSVRRHAKACTGIESETIENDQEEAEEGGDTMINCSYECTGIDSLELRLIWFRGRRTAQNRVHRERQNAIDHLSPL
jgi:uncharacterized C2H2 Zn-finger protein